MKRRVTLVTVLGLLSVLPVLVWAHTAEDPFITDLIAGRHIDAGDVLVWNDTDSLYIQYVTEDGWCLTETHLHVAVSLDGIPQTKKGNPIPGKFEYKSRHPSCVTELQYKIPLDGGACSPLYIAAQAEVVRKCQSETAWGEGLDFGLIPPGAKIVYLNAWLQPENGHADVFIPTSIQTERDGHYTNFAGVTSAFSKCFPKPAGVADAQAVFTALAGATGGGA